jgi:hypothetical protein
MHYVAILPVIKDVIDFPSVSINALKLIHFLSVNAQHAREAINDFA